MSALSEPPLVSARPLQFACGHCGTMLSVPAALAGIQGPCPCCRGLIVAPGRQVAGRSVPTQPSSPAEADLKRRGMPPARRVEAEWDDVPAPPPAASPKLVPPKPRVLRPAPPPDLEPPVVAEAPPVKRSALRRRVVAEPPAAPPPTAPPPTPPSPPAPSPKRRERKVPRDLELSVVDGEASTSQVPTSGRLWTWAGLGAVAGGGLVFAALSALTLKRDISPASAAPSSSSSARIEGEADAVAALAEHKKASAREIKSLLASQQVVWQFFATATADAARPLVSPEISAPLPAAGVQTPLTRLVLRSRHRLPDDSGLASQWSVTTTRFGELVVDVTDTSGQPRINWDKLATQLGARAAASPDQRTAGTP